MLIGSIEKDNRLTANQDDPYRSSVPDRIASCSPEAICVGFHRGLATLILFECSFIDN